MNSSTGKINMALFWQLLTFYIFSVWGTGEISAILSNRQISFPQQHQGAPGGGHLVGILTGPSNSPGGDNWSVHPLVFLNKGCQSDNDCYPTRTLLYCISGTCQCIRGGATFINGLFYNYNMEWSENTYQCVSQVGSPCTLKRYWYSQEILKMDCLQGYECAEVRSPEAKDTITQGVLGFGSRVQAGGGAVHQQQPLPLDYFQNSPYFGSGVHSLADLNGGGQNHNLAAAASSSAQATVGSDVPTNSWGICVRRSTLSNNPGISTQEQLGVSGSLGAGNGSNKAVKENGLSLIFIIFVSLSVAWCAT